MLQVVPGISRPSSFIMHMNFGVKAILIVSAMSTAMCAPKPLKRKTRFIQILKEGGLVLFVLLPVNYTFSRKGLPTIQIPFCTFVSI